MTQRISIVIPTHDRPDCLARLLGALQRQTFPPHEVLVVDDGQTPVAVGAAPCRVLRRETPSSAASRNAGLAEATGDLVLCLDDDIVPGPEVLAGLADLFARDRRGLLDVVGIPYADAREGAAWRLWHAVADATGQMRWGPRRVAARYAPLPGDLAKRVEPATMLPGGSICFRSAVARQARFDESMAGYAFGEDRELCYRLSPRYRLYRATELRVTHDPPVGGRGGWGDRGRQYVDNALHIATHSTPGGAGLWLLVGIDIAACIAQHAAWGLARGNGRNVRFAWRAAERALQRLVAAGRDALCAR